MTAMRRRATLLSSAAALAGLAATPRHAAAQAGGTGSADQGHAHPEPPAAAAAAGTAERAPGQRMTAPPDAYVYIGWPQDGQTIYGTRFKVWFGTRSFGVAPAGVDKPNTGHHHLIIDNDLPPLDQPIPNDRNHLHFGLGQTETMLDLPPGRHTLQLLMGDADHVPHDPPVMSKRITIIVRPGRTQATTAAATQ